eukprot:764429-Hanusia_phi.AAC.1
MYASVRSWVERVRLWVDNVILIDQWTSLEGTENSGTIYMGTAGGYYDVVMEYKQPNGTGGDQGISLSWRYENLTKEVMHSFYQFSEIDHSPLSLQIYSSSTTVAVGVLRNLTDTFITAGDGCEFGIIVKDLFGNDVTGKIDFQVRSHTQLASVESCSYNSDTQNSTSNTFWLIFTRSGSFQVDVLISNLSGLHATYYGDHNFEYPLLSEIHSSFPDMTYPMKVINRLNTTVRSIEWKGYLSVNESSIYEISLSANECVFLIIGDLFQVDTCENFYRSADSRDVLFPLYLEIGRYYEFATKFYHLENYFDFKFGLFLKDESPQKYAGIRFSCTSFVSNQINVTVTSNELNRCYQVGRWQSILTAGISTIFAMSCTDVYGNFVRERVSFFLQYGLNKKLAEGTNCGSGMYEVSVSPSSSGTHLFSFYYLRSLAFKNLSNNISSTAAFNGYIVVPKSGYYSIFLENNLTTGDCSEIWIEGVQIFNSCTGNQKQVYLGILEPYQVKIRSPSPDLQSRYKLLWMYENSSPTEVNNSFLFDEKLFLLALNASVAPSNVLLPESSVLRQIFETFNRSTASYFEILLRDKYGNLITKARNDLVFQVQFLNKSTLTLYQRSETGQNIFFGHFVSLDVGSGAYIVIWYSKRGGLDVGITGNASSNLILNSTSAMLLQPYFSAAPGTKPFPSLPGDSPYSIRWSGFVRPPVASVYT